MTVIKKQKNVRRLCDVRFILGLIKRHLEILKYAKIDCF